MTREDAVQHIRAITRQCRGPRKAEITPADYAKAGDELAKALAVVTDVAHGGPVKDPAMLISRMMDAGLYGEARELDRLVRLGCGADFNNVIVAGPFDATIQQYKCPKCGLTGEYQAPLFDLTAPEPAAPAAPAETV